MDRTGGYENPFIAESYDHVVPYSERDDVARYVEWARTCGGPVLELGCGTGRVLVPVARAGIEIVGLDLSTQMLAICRQKLAAESADVRARARLVEGDMTAFDLGRQFRLITTPFRPFQHILTVDGQLACLACVHRHLADEGLFVLDLFNPSLVMLTREDVGQEFGEEPEFVMPDGRRVVRRMRLPSRDFFQQVNDVELIYYVTHPNGRKERIVDAFQMRYLFRFEVEHLLARTGFRVERIDADYRGNPYGSKYPGELIVHARKARG
jgi:SAM-dependent methyltransferase